MSKSKINDDFVLINYNYDMNSIISFCQFIINNRLITLFGEFHDNNFTCGRRQKNVSDYILSCVKCNKNCKIILEYSDMFDISDINSKTMNDIYNILKKHDKLDRLVGLDIRQYILGLKMNILYHGDDIYKYNPEEIYNMFILPFNDANKKYMGLNMNDYDGVVFGILKNNKSKILNDLDRIIRELRNCSLIKKSLVKLLKEFWKKVVDFYILKYILKKHTNIDEYIILIGEYHCQNIKKVIGRYMINNLIKNKDSCINLYQIYTKNKVCMLDNI